MLVVFLRVREFTMEEFLTNELREHIMRMPIEEQVEIKRHLERLRNVPDYHDFTGRKRKTRKKICATTFFNFF